MCKTENENSDSDTDTDNFEYKVILYVTTGKIMIQRQNYLSSCNEEFTSTLNLVNTSMKTKTAKSPPSPTSNKSPVSKNSPNTAPETIHGSLESLPENVRRKQSVIHIPPRAPTPDL